MFSELNRYTPYIANGSDIIKTAKKIYEHEGKTFPQGVRGKKIAIFGDSKILTGFIPDEFDKLASAAGQEVYSFNSGFPGQDEFVDELTLMLRQENKPDIVLLTREWRPIAKRGSIFRLAEDDNEIADELFPFRLFAKNVTRFLAEASRSGGPISFYKTSQITAQAMLRARGWFFIKKLSLYSDDRLPSRFSLASDSPGVVERKRPGYGSRELDRLNAALQAHGTRCFYVPYYRRIGEFAPAPQIDPQFVHDLAQHSVCRAVGPNYFSYSPILFNDPIHLNPDGAKVYTRDLYEVLAPYLR